MSKWLVKNQTFILIGEPYYPYIQLHQSIIKNRKIIDISKKRHIKKIDMRERIKNIDALGSKAQVSIKTPTRKVEN